MTHTPMTPEMWEEAMKYPERYMIAEDNLKLIDFVKRRIRNFSYDYDVRSGSWGWTILENGQTFCNRHFTRRPDAPPMVSQAAELGSALATPTPERKKSGDFQMPITKEQHSDLGGILWELYPHADEDMEGAYRNSLAELIPHYYIAETTTGAFISLRLEVLGGNRIYQCITDDRKTGIMYILLKVLEDAK